MQMQGEADNTQSTVYEPLLQAFATLTPTNTTARITFNDVFENASLSQNNPSAEPLHHSLFMCVNPEPEYDSDVAALRSRPSDQGSFSDPPTDPETDPEQLLTQPSDSGRIWTGCYFFQMSVLPARPDLGWLAGKGRLGESPEFLLTTRQQRSGSVGSGTPGIRGRHALFMFNAETRFLGVSRASRAVNDIYVDGVPVLGQTAFNRGQARLRIGPLEYLFQYTDFARDRLFEEQRDQLLRRVYGWSSVVPPSVTPTPAPHAIVVGEWTLSSSAGKGGFGKVSIATNTRNEIVAIKMMERSARSAQHIAQEATTFRRLTELAKEKGEDRLVRLRDVIYQHGKEQYTPPRLEEVSFILEPVVRRTLAELIHPPTVDSNDVLGPADPMDMETQVSALLAKLHLYREALLGVQFLHSHGWIHGDLKPANIGIEPNPGIVSAPSLKGHAVLLDLGDAIQFKKGDKIKPSPGAGGTVNYLAPEREMYEYDESIDIWSMGVVGYELLHGKHPFKFSKNPWRRGREFESLREHWHSKYERAVDHLRGDEPGVKLDEESPEALHAGVCSLICSMLRHYWADEREQGRRRISINQALAHPCWELLAKLEGLEQVPPSKKVRVLT